MPIVLWRFLAWLGILAAFVSFAGDVGLKNHAGTNGVDLEFHGRLLQADSVEPGSVAADAGIVAGDVIALSDDTLPNRIRVFNGVENPGDHVALTVTHAGTTRNVSLVARGQPSSFSSLLIVFETIRLVLLALAALIVLRRSERPDARALASFYIAFAFGFIQSAGRYPEIVRALLQFVRPCANIYAFACLTTFAAIFPQPSVAGIRRAIPSLGRILAWISIAVIAARQFVPVVFERDPLAAIDPRDWTNTILFFAQLVLVGIGFMLAAREVRPEDRERLRWLAFSFAVGFAGLVPALALQSAGAPQSAWFLFPLTIVAVPLGSTYAILRHRVIDIGFAINRTLVFAILSGFIVFCFSLFEFVIGKYLVAIGHVQSVVIEAVLALGVALSLGRIHEIVDRFVDATLFRKRHLSELALKRLAREVSHIGDASVLGMRVVAAVARHAELDSAAIVLRDTESVYRAVWTAPAGEPFASVDDNDPAIVRLKTFRDVVELAQLADEGARSGWNGDYAFPMLVRGELAGALVCGAKRDGETLAADERSTLADLVANVAVVLDALQTDELRRAVARALAGDGGLEALRDANAASGSLSPPVERVRRTDE